MQRTLTPDQKRVFLGLAMRLCLSDTTVPVGEDVRLAQVRERLNMRDKVDANDIFSNANIGVFAEPDLQLFILYELMALAYADQKLDPNEVTVVDELAADWGVSKDDLDKVKAIAREEADLDEKGASVEERRAFNTRLERTFGSGGSD